MSHTNRNDIYLLETVAELQLKIALFDGESWAVQHILEEKQRRELFEELVGQSEQSMSESIDTLFIGD